MKSRLLLAALLLSVSGCNNEALTGAGQGIIRTQTDTFTQAPVNGQADILFVINDTDNTMVVKATRMGNSAQAFINYLLSSGVDFNIAVTSMDMTTPAGSTNVGTQGTFNGGPKVINRTTANALSAFQTNLQVGFNGAHDEHGLDASVAAVTAPLVTGANAGFLRSGARLFVVYVSDEDDNPNGTIDSYVQALTAAKGGYSGLLLLSAIAGPTPEGCMGGTGNSTDPTSQGADPGFAYADLVVKSSGLFESICDSEYSTFLNHLGFHAAGSQAQFFLSSIPSDPSTIQVTVNGVASTAWTYDPTTNSITFTAGNVPAVGAVVVITYKTFG